MSFRVNILAAALLLGIVPGVQGAIYHVSSSGSDNNNGTSLNSAWRTLARANNAVVAGDLVLVHEGQYSDGIQPRNGGQAGNPITYQAAPTEHVVLKTADGVRLGPNHSYVTVDGFEVQAQTHVAILSGSSHITIRNCRLYGGRGDYSALLLDGASYCVIQRNQLDRGDTGADDLGGDGIKLAGASHHNLIEGNTSIHCGHVAFASSLGNQTVYQSYNVWRNNTAYNNHTNFSLQDGVQRSVFENNTGYYPGLVWTGGNGWCLQFTGTNCIIRFNTLYDDTGTVYTDRRWPGIVGASSGSVNGAMPSVLYNKIYNNTVYGENDQREWSKEGWRIDNYAQDLTQNHNVFTNNIIARAPWVQIDDIDAVQPLESMANRYAGNLLCGPPGQPALVRYEYNGGNTIWNLEQAKRLKPLQWASSNKEGDPVFVNTVGQGPAKDFRLREGSPAIDAGVHLTTATGSGNTSTTLTVADAGSFIDGWGIPGVEGDSIKIEGEAPVGITRVDYEANVLTLNSPRSWSQSARVFYFRSDRFQGNAPDIGAHELVGVAPPPPPPPSRPSPPSLFSPEDGATEVSPNVTLRWNPVGSANAYRLQVSRDANFAVRDIDVSTPDPFRTMSSLTPATTYYWRVNATNSAGTSDWSRPWTLTTLDPANPSANILSNPRFDNGLESWSSYSSGQAEFSVASPGINSEYAGKLQVINPGDNTQIFQYDLPLKPDTRYIFSFAAYSRSGHDMDVSVAKHVPPFTNYGLNAVRFDLDTTWKVFTTEFTTGNFTSPVSDARLRFSFIPYATDGDQYYLDNIVLRPAPVPLLAPVPIAPPPGATNQPTDVTLRWLKRPGASAYAVEVALDSIFAAKLKTDTAVVDTQYRVSALKDLTPYYWRVKSKNNAGMSSFSPVCSFTTAPGVLPIPLLMHKPDTLQPIAFTVTWGLVAGATRYHLQLATDERFMAVVVNDSVIADTSLSIGPLRYSTRYFLRIRAVSLTGSSPFSAPVQFTTVAEALPTPTFTRLPIQNGLMALKFTVSWSRVSGATRYHLQVASDSLYTSLQVNDSTITDTLALVGPLQYATTYFMRLRAIGLTGSSPFGAPARFVTVPEVITTPAFVPLPIQNGLMPLEFTVSWFRVPGATRYHLQIASDSLYTSLGVNDSTITDTVAAVGPLRYSTRYFLRIRAVSLTGSSPFSAPVQFTTVAEALPTPTFTRLPIQNGLMALKFTVSWSRVSGATRYHLQVASDSLYTSLQVNDSTITDTLALVGPLQYATTYFMRLRAIGLTGSSPFGAPARFVTVPEVITTPAFVPLPIQNGLMPLEFTVSWFRVPGATRYHLQIASDSLYTSLGVNDSTITDTVAAVGPLRHAATYFMRLRGIGPAGHGPFSVSVKFTVSASELAVPALLPLPGEADQQPVDITFVWHPTPGAAHYHLQLSTDSLFKVLVLDDSTLTDTVRHVDSLQDATPYYLRLRAMNSLGRSGFSEPLRFTTRAGELAVPNLLEPPGQSTGRPLVTLVRWLPVAGATRYHLQLATDQQFALLLCNDSTLTDTVARVGPLAHETTYFVRVRATSDRARSSFSSPHEFSTIPAPPPAPGVIHLLSQFQGTSVTLSWPSIPGAFAYRVQVSEDSLFTTSSVDDSTVTDTVATISSLSPSTRYFARVCATGTGGTSSFSSILAFTTAGSPPLSDTPRDYSLEQNYPNPFNPSTIIRYEVPANVHVRITLFNTLGQLVKTLIDGDHAAGRYEVELTSGRLASGVYLYLFEAGNFVQTRKLLLLK